MLGAAEDQHTVHVLCLQQLDEQRALPVARHGVHGVGHGVRRLRPPADLHDDGLAEILARERLDFRRHRGAEEQCLPIARDLGDDPVELRSEAHVEHPVGFIQDEHFEIVEHDILALEVVEQSARRRDHDVHTRAERLLLRLDPDAAIDRNAVDAGVTTILLEALLDLHAQFARRRQDQRPGPPRTAGEAVEDRQRERRRLAGAGLGEADEVAALECDGDRLLLDRSRRGVTGVCHRFEKVRGEPEVREGRQRVGVDCRGVHDS
jgi:hypothetical protein